MKPISRASGRSAVASMAYRSGERLTNERDGITHDFTAKQGVEHAEIVLPEGVNADWARDRSDLWNAAEFAEKRKDARVAREFEVALPHELTAEQRLEAARELASVLANRYGAAVDFAIHSPHDASDVRNHHAHVMMTTRQVTAEGLGDKTYLERENKWLLANGLPTTDMQLRDLRQTWEGIANEHLARAGHDLRIDHRSHMERGLEIVPTEHMGVHATQMERRGFDVARTRLDEEAARRNADLIREKPEQVLSLITAEKSVFDRHDVARALHRYINDDAQEFQSAFAKVMASPALAELQPERTDPETGEVTLARYSTREMVEIESGMMESAQRMSAARDHGVDRRHVDRAIGAQDAAIQRGSGDASARLSDEQRRAIGHITGAARISAVVGFAGAGKSTMLAAAREAWEAEGYRVHGAALSGKAAEGLEESSGIQSRTLASWSRGWENERGQLGRGDVFVIDEAGMIGSRQLARFVSEAEARGAKIVLVGDHEQLQAIGAGAPFRAITEEIGHAELSEIRRQRVDWQRQASVDFATHRTAEGLAAYRDRGDIRFSADRDGARGEIVHDYLADRDARPDGTRVAMAHRRADVRAINDAIRAELQDRGELARASVPGDGEGQDTGARVFQTNDGQREFAPGDRIVFLENNRDLGVKNGMLGTVERVEEGRIIAALDGKGDSISVPMGDYQAIDHGYATTIHKNQGATVDRAFVMASGTMDRHLTYVAMTRHREGAHLYAAQDDFTDRHAGRLVEHGAAPFEHKEGNGRSYFVTLENDRGERRTTWGVDLERAMIEAKPEIGEKIGLQHIGATPVTLPDGTETQRNAWKVREANVARDAGDLAYEQLERRLSRSGAKETTLDYTRDFAERRGIAESLGIRSEIEVPREGLSRDGAEQRPEREATAERARIEDSPAKSMLEIHKDLAQDLFSYAGLDHGEDQGAGRVERQTEKPAPRRRSMFDGLKLNAASRAPAEPGQPEREGGRKVLAPAPDRLAARLRAPTPLEAAVDRYARAYASADQHLRDGLPILDMQKQELRAAGQQLNQVKGGMRNLMLSTLQHDPKTEQAITDLSGRERVARVIEGMTRENAALADPHVRAERFVTRWQALQAQRRELYGRYDDEARGKVESQLNGMAQSLERDPQVDSLLRNRRRELGLRQEPQREKPVARELQDEVERGHQISRGHGLGL